MPRDVTFAVGDGTMLRGTVHRPADGKRRAGVVMAHGFSGVKEQIDHYARTFAAGGFAVLVFDHRSFGASDGTPRREVDAYRQLDDWRDAITYALEQPEFEARAGVCVWGSSFAGGLAIVLGATDRRVRCVVAQIPNVSGARNAVKMFDDRTRERLQAAFAADRIGRHRGDPPRRIAVFATRRDEPCALPGIVSPRYVEAVRAQAPSWSNDVTLRSLENVFNFEPAGWLPFVAPKPLLFIVAEADTCTFVDVQRAAFAQAREPKHFIAHAGGHFDTYTTYFDPTSRAALEWFRASETSLPLRS